MKKIFLTAIASLAALTVCTTSCSNKSKTADTEAEATEAVEEAESTTDDDSSPATAQDGTFLFSPSGIGPVKVGADFTSIPESFEGLYIRTDLFVLCGSEDGEGVNISCYKDDSQYFVVMASLSVNREALNRISENGLECSYYLVTDPRITDILQETGSTKIESVTVVPSPIINVNIDGEVISTAETARRFVDMPGAVAVVTMGEGICVECTIGDLTLQIENANDALTPQAMERIGPKIANAMETGVFEPVRISSSDLKPSAGFDYLRY